jgi:chloride channel protein, CIC family
VSVLDSIFQSSLLNHPRWRRYTALVHEDLTQTYSRDIQKWLLLAPIIGVATGLVISLLTIIILNILWARILPFYLTHHWAIIPGLLAGFILTGLIMQFRTPDPDRHSTEEIIASYHEHQGDIDIRPFFWKLLAAITTVGSGGSAALEGPSIYSGGAIGSWLWLKLRRFGLEPEDRRLMLISGAAAGMAAVFRAPLTGIVFALEMPYKDDFVHAALLPALIASVIAYSTLATVVGAQPLFGFVGSTSFAPIDLAWAAVLGLGCGLIAMTFTITFRRFRRFMIKLTVPHVTKLAIGGLLTGICGLIFVTAFPGGLIPIGPNYEAVRIVLTRPHSSPQLVWFAVLKLAATLFSLGSGGVSAMFVPLFLVGGALGNAFALSVIHSPSFDLYAAVGMASFLAAGYKAPLTAVVFVAETTGGHSFIIPTLIGAACAYAISGESSASADQQLHEVLKFNGLMGISVREVMRRDVVSVQASASLHDFAHSVSAHHRHAIFPVYDGDGAIGIVSVWVLSRIEPERWDQVTVGEVCDRATSRIPGSCDLLEALRLLLRHDSQQMLLVGPPSGALEGIVTKTDIIRAFERGSMQESNHRREEEVAVE